MDLVVVGGSDAGISAGLRARELDLSCRVTVIVVDAYPNFSICGIPYFICGDVLTGATWPTARMRTLRPRGCSFVSIPAPCPSTRIAVS